MSRLTIITTCSNRKKLPTHVMLCARDLPEEASVAERCELWLDRLQKVPALATRAEELYAGDHWQISRALPEEAASKGHQAELWICSAGYGLISSDALVKSYGATFSTDQEDRVTSNAHAVSEWWSLLSRWAGPNPAAPRTLADLARLQHDATFVIVVSQTYLNALSDDLEAMRQQVEDPNRLIIVSAGTPRHSSLCAHQLPVDARFQHLVGGTRQTLNVRMARLVLQQNQGDALSLNVLQSKLRQLLAEQPEIKQYNRRPLSDEQVLEFIRSALADDPRMSRTRLLKLLRASGSACEQKRFKALFAQAKLQQST